jgi:acyl carrier protein
VNTVEKLQNILSEIINIPSELIVEDMPLIDQYAELDSVGIMTLLVDIENNFNIDINDIHLSMDTFATFSSLLTSVNSALETFQRL